jgi:hypothetical protein
MTSATNYSVALTSQSDTDDKFLKIDCCPGSLLLSSENLSSQIWPLNL